MSYVTAAGTLLTAFGQYQQGQAAKAQGGLQASALQYQATVDIEQGKQQAALIRRAQRYAVGRADTAAAASGVVVDSGSAGEVDRTIINDSEHDAYQAILSGNRRARGAQVQGAGALAAGDAAASNADFAAAGTVLQGGYSMLKQSGWRSAGPGWSGTQAPAPVVDRSIRNAGTY